MIVERVRARYSRPPAAALDEAIDVLFTLTSFPTFDTLAGAGRTPAEVAPIVLRLARRALGVA